MCVGFCVDLSFHYLFTYLFFKLEDCKFEKIMKNQQLLVDSGRSSDRLQGPKIEITLIQFPFLSFQIHSANDSNTSKLTKRKKTQKRKRIHCPVTFKSWFLMHFNFLLLFFSVEPNVKKLYGVSMSAQRERSPSLLEDSPGFRLPGFQHLILSDQIIHLCGSQSLTYHAFLSFLEKVFPAVSVRSRSSLTAKCT